MKKNTFFLGVMSCAVLWVTGAAPAADFDLSWYTVDGGGGKSTGGAFSLEGTLGQPDYTIMAGGAFKLSGGYWFEQPPGDCNATGTVNLLDYSDLEACLLGPDGGLGTGCECFDFDNDGDNDLVDFAAFQEALNP